MENKTKEAVQILITALKEDEDYYRGWKDNIAMAFKDEVENKGLHSPNPENHSILMTREMLHKIANNAADNFLQLLIK
jgi:hypothetical protein